VNKSFLLGGLFLIALFASCKRNDYDAQVKRWQSKHLEAKLYDVPVLLNAQLVQNINNTACVDESSIVSYEVPVDHEQASLFYQEEMERLGWWQTAAFKGSESLLNFEKPNKYCSVSIRPLKKISRVIIFIGQKNYD
jgi:hypothetical protein